LSDLHSQLSPKQKRPDGAAATDDEIGLFVGLFPKKMPRKSLANAILTAPDGTARRRSAAPRFGPPCIAKNA